MTQWMEGGSLYQNIYAQEDWEVQLGNDQGYRALSIAMKVALGMVSVMFVPLYTYTRTHTYTTITTSPSTPGQKQY